MKRMRNAECGMRSAVALVVTLLVASPIALVGQTSLSIYADGRVVVRRTVPQALEKGRNTLTLRLDDLDPATLFSPDTSVAVLAAVLHPPTMLQEALRRARGQVLSFAREQDTVRATVMSVEPPQYRLPDGRLLLVQPGVPLFPADLVRTSPEVSLVVEAGRARPSTELAYVAQGATWEAVYQVVLGAREATVSGVATVTSQAVRADSAEVQLVAGAIRRARYAPPPVSAALEEGVALRAMQDQAGGEAPEQAVGETHVYDLPGKLTLEPGVPATRALFPRARTAYDREFVIPGALPYRGYFGGQPAEPNRVPVQVWYTLKRARGRATPFGDRPLPRGTVQVYQADSGGRLQLVGEALIDHTPAGRELRVHSGDAFDITAERVQTEYQTEQLPPARRWLPSRQRITAAFRVTLTNAKPEAVTVDVREVHFGEWKVTVSSVPEERLSASEVRFRVPVPAGGEATLTYTVQVDS